MFVRIVPLQSFIATPKVLGSIKATTIVTRGDSARMAAEDTLLDQVLMSASPEAFEQFQARLDMPPNANDRLRKTMSDKAPWEHE